MYGSPLFLLFLCTSTLFIVSLSLSYTHRHCRPFTFSSSSNTHLFAEASNFTSEGGRQNPTQERAREMKNQNSMVALLLLLLLASHRIEASQGGFVGTRGLHFVHNGGTFFANGFNAYWLMLVASDPSQRGKITSAFQEASGHGLTVARTWAFSDGGYRPLQSSPGVYSEAMFRGLDFVLEEARRFGIRVILSLVDNYGDLGGKKQYVDWARARGRWISSDDGFFTDPVVKQYYKNHVRTVLTRINSFTGVAYKNDPTIFAWELMNEPRCQSDQSGKTIQGWITEMAAYVKSIDSNHLLEAGLEGFYGPWSSQKLQANPGFQVGTDFIANNQIAGIDFATIHSYPDQWMPKADDRTQLAFLSRWIDTHVEDARSTLRKPLLLTEFGKSWKDPGFSSAQRDALFNLVYSKIFRSARTGGPCAGGLFWHLLTGGLDSYRDGYEIILNETPSTASVIAWHSRHLRMLGRMYPSKAAAAPVMHNNSQH